MIIRRMKLVSVLGVVTVIMPGSPGLGAFAGSDASTVRLYEAGCAEALEAPSLETRLCQPRVRWGS